MTRLFAAGALSCALVLSACNVTSGQVRLGADVAAAIGTAAGKKDLVVKAQGRVVQACGFLPTAKTVVAIARTFAPSTEVTLDLADTVATGICAAVQNPTVAYASGRTARRGTYRGVPVRGRPVTTGQ